MPCALYRIDLVIYLLYIYLEEGQEISNNYFSDVPRLIINVGFDGRGSSCGMSIYGHFNKNHYAWGPKLDFFFFFFLILF